MPLLVAAEVVPGEHFNADHSNRGTLVRTRVDEVSQVGRNTQGVTLIRTGDQEFVVGMARIGRNLKKSLSSMMSC